MANVLDLRRRIRSVKNTQQITRAMKMVAAARLRRAQEHLLSGRPFADQIQAVLRSVVARTHAGQEGEPLHPLLAERPVEKVLLVVVTSDRGLCGAFNANLVRATQNYLEQHHDQQVQMIAAGRKGRDFLRKRPVALIGEYVSLFGRRLGFSSARELAHRIIDLYAEKAVDAVDLIYSEFKSIVAQRVKVERYLPVKPIEPAAGESLIDYIYEQPPEEIFRSLLPRYVEAEVYRALLESQAGFFAAQMTAMDAATTNAAELIDTLTLHLNRVRQASITKEIIEIVSGAAAQ